MPCEVVQGGQFVGVELQAGPVVVSRLGIIPRLLVSRSSDGVGRGVLFQSERLRVVGNGLLREFGILIQPAPIEVEGPNVGMSQGR